MSGSEKVSIAWDEFVQGRVPKGFRELSEIPNLRADLRYASTDNFTGQNLYGPFKKAFLHEVAFLKLEIAAAHLRKNHPDLDFLILDALRPRAVQRILFSKVVGTPEEIYVANPDKGSVHNYGMAVDLTLARDGVEIDMGTPFDDFTELAQPRLEEKFLASGELSSQQHAHRLALRNAMESGGFKIIPNEWWHFNALPIAEVKAGYQIVE